MMTGLELLEYIDKRVEIARDCRDSDSEAEWAFWDGQIAALRDIKKLIEVQVLTESLADGSRRISAN